MQVTFYLRVKLLTLSLDQKLKYYKNVIYNDRFEDFIPNFVRVLTKKI